MKQSLELLVILFTFFPALKCLSQRYDALCNNGTNFVCICYHKDGSLIKSYQNCSDFIVEPSLGVVEMEVVEDFNPLDRFATTGTEIEPYFKKQVAWLVSSYCERLVNNCKGIGLAIKQASVVLLHVSCSASNRTLIQFVITKSRYGNTELQNSSTMDPALISNVLKLRVRKLEESTGIWHVFDIRPKLIVSSKSQAKPKEEEKPQNFAMSVALIIVAFGLGICYFIASVKVIKDHLARKKAERLRESSKRETTKSYGAMDNTKVNDGPPNIALPVPRPVDVRHVEAPSNGGIMNNSLPVKNSPGSRRSSIIEVDVGYMAPEPDREAPQPQQDNPVVRRAPPPVPRQNTTPNIGEDSRKSSHSSSSSRRHSSSSSNKHKSSTSSSDDVICTANKAQTPPSPAVSPADSVEVPRELHETFLVLPNQLEAAVRRAVSSQDVNMNDQSVGEHDSNSNTLFPQANGFSNEPCQTKTTNEITRSQTVSDFPNTQTQNAETNYQAESSSSGSDTEVDEENDLIVPGDYETLAGSSDNLLDTVASAQRQTNGEEKLSFSSDNPAFVDSENLPSSYKPAVVINSPSIDLQAQDEKSKPRSRPGDEESSSGSDSSSAGDTVEEDTEQGGQLTTMEYARLAESNTSLNQMTQEKVHDTISEYDLRDMNTMQNLEQNSRDTSQEWATNSNSDTDLK